MIDTYNCRSTLITVISVDHITVEVKKKEVLLMALTSHRSCVVIKDVTYCKKLLKKASCTLRWRLFMENL